MGNCLQAACPHHQSDDLAIDNIYNESSINRAASIQSRSMTTEIITTSDPSNPPPPPPNSTNTKHQESPSNSSSTPTVSQITELPNIPKKTSKRNLIHRDINNKHNILENMPVSSSSHHHINNINNNKSDTTIIFSDTPTITNPSNPSSNYLDTPNDLFGATPSSITINSSQSLPPLRLSVTNTDTKSVPSLSSNESDKKHVGLYANLSNAESGTQSINNEKTPSPISPEPASPCIDTIKDLHTVNMAEMDEETIDIEEEKQLRNKKSLNRKRASSHDSMGITALFRGKSTFSFFNITKKRNKNATNKKSATPNLVPITDTSNSMPTRQRGQTYHSPHTSTTNMTELKLDENDTETSIESTIQQKQNRTKRALTFHGILSFRSSNSSNKANSKRPFSAKISKRAYSVHSNKKYKKHGSENNENRIKLKYKRNTPIQPLESFAAEGNIQGIISVLKKFENNYPPFFMEYSDEKGHTLLMKAARLGHFLLMKYLINRYNEYKHAIFDTVEPYYGKDIASLLLDFMGDYINYESNGGKSALIFACDCKHSRMNMVRYLLESGASVADPRYSLHGKSPLIHATEWKQQKLIELLLEYGADINVQDRNNGFTPLMYAAKFNNQDLCEFLLARNADITLTNKNGKTATDLAKEDQCWASLLAIDPSQIPPNKLPIAASTPSKNTWGRYSLSYQ